MGPTLSLRGLDNAAYYRLDPNDRADYVDTSGCGNALNVGNPSCLRLIMDSLRYWVTEMGVDGFRFDLAPDPGPSGGRLRHRRRLLRSGLAGPGDRPDQTDRRAVGRRSGRQLRRRAVPRRVERVERQIPGHRPRLLAQPRRSAARSGDQARRFAGPVHPAPAWPGRLGQPDHRARRVHPARTWCPTTTNTTRRTPSTTGTAPATTDPGTAVSKARSTDPAIAELRARQRRAMLSTLLLARGVPLLLGGDEVGRTQQGNNNAYCQDNEIAWWDWSSIRTRELRDFTAQPDRAAAPASRAAPPWLPDGPDGDPLVHPVRRSR